MGGGGGGGGGRGPAGPAGRDGKDGASPSLDDVVAAVLAKLPPPTAAPEIDYSQIAARLLPITFERVDEHGKAIGKGTPVYLGKKIKFAPLKVNYLNDSNQIVDTEYVQAIGGTLNLHIGVLQK